MKSIRTSEFPSFGRNFKEIEFWVIRYVAQLAPCPVRVDMFALIAATSNWLPFAKLFGGSTSFIDGSLVAFFPSYLCWKLLCEIFRKCCVFWFYFHLLYIVIQNLDRFWGLLNFIFEFSIISIIFSSHILKFSFMFIYCWVLRRPLVIYTMDSIPWFQTSLIKL